MKKSLGQYALERLKVIGERTLNFCSNNESKQVCQGMIDQIGIELAVLKEMEIKQKELLAQESSKH